MDRIAVAMSGGVDSCTTAALLHEAGHDVVGITLQLWDHTGTSEAAGTGRCCSPAEVADARRVAAQIGFPHYVFDHSDAFRERIVEPFLDGWSAGTTPSPCIDCNRAVKFDLLWRLARSVGATHLATGHYARLEFRDDRPQVRKAQDRDKDQSYFLFQVRPDGLRDVLFPLGEMDKGVVREQARRLGLPVADKPESYELCFVPDGDKDAFVARHRPSLPGTIRDTRGRMLGTHDGLHRFTVGQRRGLGVSAPRKLYVVAVDGEDASVTVGERHHLDRVELVADRCNWLAVPPPTGPIRAAARIRHRHREAAATIEPLEGDRVRVSFDEPQSAIAPGQGVAFYDGDLLLGGGWIAAS